MKKNLLLTLLFLFSFQYLHAQSWIAKIDFGGTGRNRACSFSIPELHKYYLVGGYDYSYSQEVWEFDTLTNAWTQKQNFPGASTTCVAFSINGKGYVGTGVGGGYTWSNLFYEYDPSTDTWTQKANFPGAARGYCVGFATETRGYIGGGFNGTPGVFIAFTDFYEYDPATDSWIAIANYPGAGAALGASGFSVNGKGYVGCGSSIDVNGVQTLHNDFWEYDPVTNSWNAKANYAGGIIGEATSFSICDKGYIGLGYNVPHASFKKDFYQFDPATNTWNQIADYGGPARAYSPGAAIGNSGYAGTGHDGIILMKDFYEYRIKHDADFSASDTLICVGDAVSFLSISNFSTTNWNWNFSGGNPSTSTLPNPTINFDAAGYYDITLTVYGECDSITITKTNYIHVIDFPSINNLGNDTAICEGDSLLLDAGNGGGTFLWSNGSTAQSIWVSVDGNYFVVVSDGNCSGSDSIVITIINCNQPSLSVSDTSVCQKFCVNYFDLTLNSVEWHWTFEGGSPSTSILQNPTQICYNTPGVYDVTLITKDALGNSDTIALLNFMTVNATPALPTITQVGYVLTSSIASSYQWQFNSVDIPGATLQSYTATSTGFYTVVIGNETGCVSSNTIYVLITGVEEISGNEF
ncbi:MAG: hypothetical protein LH473_11650, partial [Chitinophagales bacterium]|nr:hypothetical protein [Chitinophagales bacterium]